jgi:hypothetical protein
MKSNSTFSEIRVQGKGDMVLHNPAETDSSSRAKLFSWHTLKLLSKAMTFVLVLILLTVVNVAGQSPYTSVASGNWNSDATWSGTGIPVAGSIVTINGGFTVTVSADAACTTLNIGGTTTGTGAGTLVFNSGTTLTVSGNVTMGFSFSRTGTLTMTSGGTLAIGGIFSTNSGDYTYNPGTGTVNYNGAAQTVFDMTSSYNNLTLSGSGAKTTTGITVNGILSMEGTATTTGTVPTYGAAATLQYKGSGIQTTGTEFPATFSGSGGVIINNSNGVTLGAAKTISSSLTLTAGIFATTSTNLLSVTGTSVSAISGGSITSFINGPVRWSLPASLSSGSTYNFPVGDGTTYLPFSLVNPTTGTGVVTAQVEATVANAGGTVDATLTSLSTTEYWALTTAGNFANSSVSLTRQTAISPLDAIGGSATQGGVYISLVGTAGTNGVTGSNTIGSNRFFVLARKASAGTTYTSTGAGGQWNTAATWSPAAVPTAGSNVIIATGAPVTVNVNTAAIANLTVNSSLDASTFTVSGTGTLTVAGTGTLLVGANNFPSGFAITTLSSGSTVNYNGAAQTVSAQTYSNLTLSGSGVKTLTGLASVGGNLTLSGTASATTAASLTIGGNLDIGTGTAFTIGSSFTLAVSGTSTVTGTGLITNNGTFTVGTALAGTGGLTNSGTGILYIGGTSTITTLTATASGNTVNYSGAAQTVKGTTYHNLTLSGSGAKTTTGATVNGILSMEGTATTTGTIATYGGSSTLQYKGTAAQTTGTEFPATFSGSGGVIINNSNGVALGSAKSISSTLTLTSGILTTSGANLLSITNTSASAISGGSTTSFINGPLNRSLPASLVSGSTYNFPVGKVTTYLPLALVNPTTGTGTPTAQAEAFSANPGGTLDATLVSKSTTEYWSLTTAGNFTNSSVSITRQTAISPFDVIGGSTTLTGIYTSLAGTAATNGVTGSTVIGANRFFVFARKGASLYTSVAPGGNWNSAATWNPASVPPAGSNIEISAVGPVAVTATPANVADLSIEGLLDVDTYTVTGTGTLYVSATGTLLVGGTNNFPAGFPTMNLNTLSYVNYNNSGNQTVAAATYGNLILSNSGIKTLPASGLTIDGNFAVTGSATITPTNAFTVSGSTTLAASSVLTLGAANILSNSGSVTLDGGTFRTGATTGYSETVGVLTVANNSIIALGTGVHSLIFAPSNGVSWSGTSLTISGWTGTTGATGTAGKIFFGSSSSSLTAAQLAKISFSGFPGTNAALLSTGELVPTTVPVLAITGITDHGSSCIGTAATQQTYTITNTGGPATGITVTSNNAQFVVTGTPTSVAGGGTATYTVTFTPAASGVQNATITVASTTAGSNSPTSSLTGTGNEFPVAGLTSSDADNSICAGDAVTFTATGGVLYEFFVDAVSHGAASATATFTTTALTTGQIVTVKVTNASSCFATSTGINTTVNEIPAAPVVTGISTVAVGAITTLGSAVPGGTWTSSDPTKATVDSSTGEVTGIAEGTTTITYTVSNPNGCTNFGTLLVTVTPVTGIEDLLDVNGLAFGNHPNPFVWNTMISYTLPYDGRVTITIRNLAGQVLKTIVNEMQSEGNYTINPDVADLQPGIYLATLRLKNNGKEISRTIRVMKGK